MNQRGAGQRNLTVFYDEAQTPQAQTHRKYTRESINAARDSGIEIIDEYTHAKDYLNYQRTEHGYEFSTTLNSALYCGGDAQNAGAIARRSLKAER